MAGPVPTTPKNPSNRPNASRHMAESVVTRHYGRMHTHLRRALHQAVDMIIDAIEDDRTNQPRKRTRAPAKPPPMPPDATPEEIARIENLLARKGYRRRDVQS